MNRDWLCCQGKQVAWALGDTFPLFTLRRKRFGKQTTWNVFPKVSNEYQTHQTSHLFQTQTLYASGNSFSSNVIGSTCHLPSPYCQAIHAFKVGHLSLISCFIMGLEAEGFFFLSYTWNLEPFCLSLYTPPNISHYVVKPLLSFTYLFNKIFIYYIFYIIYFSIIYLYIPLYKYLNIIN